MVINSHFPFQNIQIFPLHEIKNIKISSDWRMRIFLMFGGFHSNYIQIETMSQKKKYYCLFLDFDCHDENWTDSNLDDLEQDLKIREVQAELEH